MDIDRYLTLNKICKPIVKPSAKEGSPDSEGVDLPFVFFHNNKFFMMHLAFDKIGYQTMLKVSDNILGEYQDYSLILKRGEGNGWDSGNSAGAYIISEQNLFSERVLKKINGKYWLVYHSYPGAGYENGAASIGLAYCEDEDLKNWIRLESPILTPDDGKDWERGGLYKECIVEENGMYYMFYNAKDKETGKWIEQTGVAFSKDLINWTRYENNPILKVSKNSWDSRFVSDPFIVKDGDLWLNFYFGMGEENALAGLAFSKDLLNWEKYPQPIISLGKNGDIDDRCAHKSCVVFHNGELYHFYCAVNLNYERVITCAHN